MHHDHPSFTKMYGSDLIRIESIVLVLGDGIKFDAGAVGVHHELMPGESGYLQFYRSYEVSALHRAVVDIAPVDRTGACKEDEYLRVLGKRDTFVIVPATYGSCLAEDDELLTNALMIIFCGKAAVIIAGKFYGSDGHDTKLRLSVQGRSSLHTR